MRAAKLMIRKINNIEEIDILLMKLNTHYFHVNEQKVHSSYFKLYRSHKTVGMIGTNQSELINKLTKKL